MAKPVFNISNIEKISLTDDDILIIKIPDSTSASQAHFIRKNLNSVFKGVKMMMCSDKIDFTVISKKEAKTLAELAK